MKNKNIVYKITNKTNGKFYIGSTNNEHRRMLAHFCNHTCTQNQNNDLHMDIKKLNEDDFDVEVLLETQDIIEASRLESSIIRENKANPLMYNKIMGASGRRVFYESDIIFIRQLYERKSIYINDAYEKYYKGIVTHRAFKKVWHGETFKDIYYHVYTEENKLWHFSKGQSRPGSKNGKSRLSEEDVLEIRKRRDNGEEFRHVFEDYKYTGICYDGVRSIWNNRTWKYLI